MGNRAYLIFADDKVSDDIHGFYVHWNGGPESIHAFLKVAREFCATDPTPENMAHLVHDVALAFIEGSVYPVEPHKLANLPNLASTADDNGVYMVNASTLEVVGRYILNWRDDKLQVKSYRQIQAEKKAAMGHEYWTSTPSIVEETRRKYAETQAKVA